MKPIRSGDVFTSESSVKLLVTRVWHSNKTGVYHEDISVERIREVEQPATRTIDFYPHDTRIVIHANVVYLNGKIEGEA